MISGVWQVACRHGLQGLRCTCLILLQQRVGITTNMLHNKTSACWVITILYVFTLKFTSFLSYFWTNFVLVYFAKYIFIIFNNICKFKLTNLNNPKQSKNYVFIKSTFINVWNILKVQEYAFSSLDLVNSTWRFA